MPYLKPERPEKVNAPSLKTSKQRGERLVCLTHTISLPPHC